MIYVRLVSKLFAFCIVAALCACGAAKADRNVVAPTTAAPLSDNSDARPVIACFGDSITAGFGVDPDASYPANLQRDLDAAGYKYRVANMGVSGETTKDGLSRVNRVIA